MIEDTALKIRQEVFKMAVHANGGHIAPAFSMADIIAVMYFDDVLRWPPPPFPRRRLRENMTTSF